MKTRVLILALSTLLAVEAAAQSGKPATQAPAAPATSSIKVSNDGQWEYLVISFGKTYYSSPTDIAAKQAGESKLMIFGPLGGVIASEAVDVQRQVDALGRYGWELIGVLGSIGGDQQWVFKRPFDPARAATEAAQIKKEGDALAAARDKAAKEAAAKPPTTELVDLDAQEAAAKQARLNEALRDRIATALQLAGIPIAKITTSGLSARDDGTPTSLYNEVTVHLDAQRALSGNTYRRSTVQSMIDEYMTALRTQGRFTEVKKAYSCYGIGEIKLNIGASIKFNGEWKDVVYPSSYCVK